MEKIKGKGNLEKIKKEIKEKEGELQFILDQIDDPNTGAPLRFRLKEAEKQRKGEIEILKNKLK